MNWEVNNSRTEKIHRLKIVIDDLTLPTGEKTRYSYIKFGKAVCILPITEDNKIICIRQYRHPIRKWQWELPAGLIDEDDSEPLAAAMRELEEETGYQAREWTPLESIYPSAGAITEHTYLFAASELVKTQQKLEKTEQLELHELDLKELYSLVTKGEFQQGAGVAAILQYILRKNGESFHDSTLT